MPEPGTVAALADELARELGATPRGDAPELAWLEDLASAADTDIAAARCARPDDHLEHFVARLVPTLSTPFVVYGAGQVGQRIAALCRAQGRTPAAFVETAPAHGVVSVNGLPLWSPRRARDVGIGTVVFGTWASTAAMHATLRAVYGAAFGELRCESPIGSLRGPASGELTARLRAAADVVGRGRSLSEYLWLMHHADERMDAAVPVNRDDRRLFHVDRYRFAAAFACRRRVLDCASGTGYGSGWIDRHASPADVLGVDLDEHAVAYAARHYGSPRVVFRQGDACRLDDLEDASRDLVISFETIEHVADAETMLSGFARILTADGVLVTSTPNDWPVDISPYHVRSYDAAGFEDVLRRSFAEVTLFAHVVPRDHDRGGVLPWTGQSPREAECLVAVCRLPRPR